MILFLKLNDTEIVKNLVVLYFNVKNFNYLEKYSATTSIERITAFITSNNDSEDEIINRYNKNIKISQALYPDVT